METGNVDAVLEGELDEFIEAEIATQKYKMILFDKVSKIYSKTSIALDGVNLSISHKEFVSFGGAFWRWKAHLLNYCWRKKLRQKEVSILSRSTCTHCRKENYRC